VEFNWSAPGYGEAYKKALREPLVNFDLTGFGEVLPGWENRVEIDCNIKDIYGIPVVKIYIKDSDNERANDQGHGRFGWRNARSRGHEKHSHLRAPFGAAVGAARSRHRANGNGSQEIRAKPISADP
jgi:hypothetical protein